MSASFRLGALRVLGFCLKELRTVVQQPFLIAGLTLGPFLVLALFGLGFEGPRPQFRTVLVIPEGSALAVEPEVYRDAFTGVFQLAEVTRDEAQARALLRAGEVDVVAIVPPAVPELIYSGQQAALQVIFAEIDPTAASWVHYFAQEQAGELNRRVLLAVFRQAEQQTAGLVETVREVDALLAQLEQDLRVGDTASASARAARLAFALGEAQAALDQAALALGDSAEDGEPGALGRTEQQLQAIRQELAALQQDLAAGPERTDAALRRVERIRASLGRLEELAAQFAAIPVRTLVSPFIGRAENVAPVEPTYVAYYTPAALALILQHMAVTLSSLSAVRDRLLGTLDWFRVSPAGPASILLGKSLGYAMLLAPIAILLTAAVLLVVGVPLVGSPLLYALSLSLVVFAAVGLGFALATIARTESQVVQLSLVVLLLAIFFGGFFLPLEFLHAWVRPVSFVLPATFGVVGLRDVMLRGEMPGWPFLVGPFLLGLAFYGVAAFGLWRQMRRG